MAHPLLGVLLEAARGRPPEPDGLVEVLPALPGPVDAVAAFTAHTYVVADIDPELVRSHLRPGDPGGPTLPAFLAWLAAHLGGRAGQVDAVLAALGLEGAPPIELEPRTDLGHHHRVARASRYRSEVRVFASPGRGGVLVLGRGLAGRREAAFEVEPERRGQGLGRALALAARHLVAPDEPVFVQVSPGNAASLRAVLAAGYRPIGGEVLLPRTRE
jgi:GNAT superfamily N-acetyltransferase